MAAREGPYRGTARPYVKRYAYKYREHVFDKLRNIDLTLREFQALLGEGEVVAEVREDGCTKELILLIGWLRPLHVVIAVDDIRAEERIVTVYEPNPQLWTSDFKRKKGRLR